MVQCARRRLDGESWIVNLVLQSDESRVLLQELQQGGEIWSHHVDAVKALSAEECVGCRC